MDGETFEFWKMILSSPAVIVLLTATAGLIPVCIQTCRDREKQRTGYDNMRRDAYFQEKKKIYLDFLEFFKSNKDTDNNTVQMLLVIEASKLEIFAPPFVRQCASEFILNLIPKGHLLAEKSKEGRAEEGLRNAIQAQQEHPETEEEAEQRRIRFSVALQNLQNAMREDLENYTKKIPE